MKLVVSLIALLVISSTGAQRIKGGRRVLTDSPFAQGPHVHAGKGGGGGALHHTAVVQDPLSGAPVVVEKLSPIGGVKGGGLGGGLGAGSVQLAVGDGPFGQRQLYRVGQSQVPYGLLGLDYGSYPTSLLTAPRGYGRKTILSDNLSGLRPVGFGGRTIIADPSTSQFSVGDAQIKTSAFGARRPLYRSGLSPVPYGLLGSDYYSYPRQLLTQRALGDDFGLGQTRILSGGSAFTSGDSQIRGGLLDNVGQEKVTVVESDPLSGTQRVTTVQKASPTLVRTTGGLAGGQIILSGARGLGGLRRVKSSPVVATIGSSGLGAPFGGFGQRQVAVTKSAPTPIVQAPVAPVRVIQAAPSPVRFVQSAPAPVRVVQAAPAPVQVIQAAPAPSYFARRPVDTFLSQIARPRVVTVARPAQRVAVASPGYGNVQFTLGGNQIIGGGAPVFAAPAPQLLSAPRVVAQAPVIAAAPRVLAAPRIVSQAPVLTAAPQISQIKTDAGFGRSIFGNRAPQLIYVDGGRRFPGIDIIGGSRIGDPRLGYTQLPISTSRFASLGLNPLAVKGGSLLSTGPSKIGGAVVSGPLGLTGIGRTSPSKVVTQEEVIGPAGDSQVITTITETDSNNLIPSKIGGFASGGPLGVAGLKGSGPRIVTQEEVVGPAGDPQVITTVTQGGGPSKIGGPVVGGLGLGGIGAGSQTITQEEVIGPAGDSQIITTVTNNEPSKIGGFARGGLAGIGAGPTTIVQQEDPFTGLRTTSQISQVSQDPFETAIQETLGDSAYGQSVQSLVDPLGGGQTQVSVDDFGGVTQVKETLVSDPLTGEVNKVTEVTKSGGALAQQNIADAIAQENIASGFGGSRVGGYSPRVSFLSQFPYDAPDAGVLRSVISRPVFQQQQEVEQILVK